MRHGDRLGGSESLIMNLTLARQRIGSFGGVFLDIVRTQFAENPHRLTCAVAQLCVSQ